MGAILTVSTIVILLLIVLKIIKTINRIKALRERGINVSNKNIFYKWVTNTFLKNLPL
ncbi:hypothetical protein [Pontimicrobium sp. MEBiC01747]